MAPVERWEDAAASSQQRQLSITFITLIYGYVWDPKSSRVESRPSLFCGSFVSLAMAFICIYSLLFSRNENFQRNVIDIFVRTRGLASLNGEPGAGAGPGREIINVSAAQKAARSEDNKLCPGTARHAGIMLPGSLSPAAGGGHTTHPLWEKHHQVTHRILVLVPALSLSGQDTWPRAHVPASRASIRHDFHFA